jgi:hypothetical protein
MLNNVYETNPQESKALEEAMKRIDELSQEKLYLKRLILSEKHKQRDLQKQNIEI